MRKDEYSEVQPLAGDVDGLQDDHEAESLDENFTPGRRRNVPLGRRVVVITGILILFVASSLLSGAIGIAIGRRKTILDAECAAHTTQYSPVLKDVDIKYAVHQFNGSFMQEEIYRQAGSPQVDAAWEALGVDYRAGLIPVEEGLKSGLTHGHVQRAEKYGGGFFVNVEGCITCTNLLRKSLFYNYDYYKGLGTHAFLNDDHILQLHVSHCLDIIRQVLMCNVDTGVLGQVWFDKGNPTAFPDFNTRHVCKNYDAVRQWAERHQAEPSDSLPPDYMLQPDLADVLPATP